MQQGHVIFELTIAVLALAALGWIGFLAFRINRVLTEMKTMVDATRRRIEPVIEEAHELSRETREGVSALLEQTRTMVGTVARRTEDIAEMTHDQAIEIRALARDTVLVARNKVEQLDDLLTRATSRVDQTATAIQKEVLEPIHEIHCVIVGVRRALRVFFSRRKQTPVNQVYQEEDLFI